uniref:Uncharacterized protein n=1 Tax=Chaetoceros debilis TaxID=122233 RepID=A0A7S3PZ51_9STRA
MASNTEESLLPPSKFKLPDDFEENRGDYEIWSVRAPVKFKMNLLEGATLQFNLDKSKKGGRKTKHATTVEIDGDKYSFSQEHTSEVESFRILSASADVNDDSDDELDEERKRSGMVPLPMSFKKHFNIVQTTNDNIPDVDLAPSTERASDLDMKNLKMRIPYTHIDQKSGLKRRWNMMGAGAEWVAPAGSKVDGGNNIQNSMSSTKSKKSKTDKKNKKDKKAKSKKAKQ